MMIDTNLDRNVMTPAERRAQRVKAMTNHSYRCGVLTARVQSMLPCLRDALAEVARKNKHGVNDGLIRELTRQIRNTEELFDDLNEADCEVNERLGLAPLSAEGDAP